MTKILFLGGNLVSVNCLQALLAIPQIQIVGILPRGNDDGTVTDPNAWNYSLRKFAQDKKLPILSRLETAQAKQLSPDYIISVQYDKILKKEMIEIPSVGCLNLHFSPLPAGRGCKPISWAIINNERSGVTLHWIDKGVDTGAIISQLSWETTGQDTAYSLYTKAVKEGTTLFKQSIPKMIDKKLKSKKQSKKNVSYYPQNKIIKPYIDWSGTSELISAKIRALDFPGYPGAKTTYNMLRKAKTPTEIKAPVTILADNSGHRYGTILQVGKGYVDVKTINGKVRVTCPIGNLVAGESFT